VIQTVDLRLQTLDLKGGNGKRLQKDKDMTLLYEMGKKNK